MAMVLDFDFVTTPLGECLAARSPRGLCHLDFTDGDRAGALARLAGRFPASRRRRAGLARLVRTALAGGPAAAQLPLDLQGTPFQARVWQALRVIPAGQTVSYGELARRLGRPRASRAVAGAVARNALAMVVPCHRVVRADGQLGGYRWGPARKAELLRREA